MPESRDELDEQLQRAAADQYPVRIARDHKWWASDVRGFVVSVGERWVVIQKLEDAVYFAGYEVLRRRDLTEVEDNRENGYIERAVRVLGRPPVDFGLPDSATTIDVLRAAAKHSTLVNVYVEKIDEDALLIGHLAQHRNKKFDMQLIGPTGVWTTGTSSWRYKDVTRVTVGGRYDAALERFGDSRPALPSDQAATAQFEAADIATPPEPVGAAVASPISTVETLPHGLSSRPRMHREASFLARKQARLREPHVSPINDLVDAIRDERGAFVPYVDPDSGGALARVLFVLESPARPAAHGSGMLSPDNDDATAANMWEAYSDSGLSRNLAVHWNAVPWFVGDSSREKNVTTDEVTGGHRYLRELLGVADKIEVIVGMGKPAQTSLNRMRPELERRGIRLIECIHPSPRNNGRGGREQVAAAFREVLHEISNRR